MDFHNFTSTHQFDMDKINKFAKLDAIPGFCLLRSEREYLNLYRKLLTEEVEAEKDIDASGFGFTGQPVEEKPAEKTEQEAPKTKKKTKKTEE